MIAIMAGPGSRRFGFPLSFSEVTRKFQHTGPSTRSAYPQAVDNFAFLVDEAGCGRLSKLSEGVRIGFGPDRCFISDGFRSPCVGEPCACARPAVDQ
ncbi:hypothetical protein GCM10010486_06710 [Nonomuraea roseoviolacea subsp. carminata]